MISGKKHIEEILGMSFRARHKEVKDTEDSFPNLIIHQQIQGDEIYTPLNTNLWESER
ncbi:hypothetical protein SAMN05192533_13214 [Mesobacillus persicus]|uniref:Uncharacterized protein n=1 Tax=Mesobacillus persicus TaxID=930146 RepID=A0A1H8KUB9_9BACI|nr:hypothetical protein [Mesobacillus persicus]SEN96469.1 hypothetical protein SAMN05192533_13214 [Mesobacillus persicus]